MLAAGGIDEEEEEQGHRTPGQKRGRKVGESLWCWSTPSPLSLGLASAGEREA